jgi:hypothetical protein
MGGQPMKKKIFFAFGGIIFALLTASISQAVIPTAERNALIDLYNSTDGANWTNNTNWRGDAGTECSWHGVVCDVAETHVVSLSLDNNNLVGTIPGSIGDLQNLTSLTLTSNQLFGSIPAELGSLSLLTELRLRDNQLSGNIPIELGNLTSLATLDLHFNRLIGNVPAELGLLTNLWHLYLGNNQLTGYLPVGLGNLTNLRHLLFDHNRLTGKIPQELGNLTNLTFLVIMENRLIGPIPSSITNLTNLEDDQNDFCNNSLYTLDLNVDAFLTAKQTGGDWTTCQNTDPDNDGTPLWNDNDNDNDGLLDSEEFNLGTDPLSSDTDGDDLTDYEEEVDHSTDPTDPDSDGDYVSDWDEINNETLPNDPNSFTPAGTGGIRGTLKDTGDNPITSHSIEVQVYTGDPCGQNEHVTSGSSNSSDGTYAVINLDPGRYYLRTVNWQAPNYVNEWWSLASISIDCNDAQAIDVVADDWGDYRDFQLDLGGSVSGILTTAVGDPIPGIHVNVFSDCGGFFLGFSEPTEADGNYAVYGLPAEEVYVHACGNCGGAPFVPEWWDGAGGSGSYDCGEALPAVISVNQNTSNIDFALDEGGTITGHIYEQDGQTPVEGACVDVSYTAPDWDHLTGWCCTNQDGLYTISNLPAGIYYLYTQANCQGNNPYLVDEWYADGGSTPDGNEADPIQVTSGQTTSGKNFTLDVGGAVSGNVLDKNTLQPVLDKSSGSIDLSEGWYRFIYRQVEIEGGQNSRAAFKAPGDTQWRWFSTSELNIRTTENGPEVGILLTNKRNTWEDYHPRNHQELVDCVDNDSTEDGDWYGQSVVNIVNHEENIHGNDDFYTSYYESYFYVDSGSAGIWWFSTDSDDASEIVINDTVVAYWYGGHGSFGRWEHKFGVNLYRYDNHDDHVKGTGGNPDGTYILTGVPPGDYILEATAPGYLREYYQDRYTMESATMVTVVSGQETALSDLLLVYDTDFDDMEDEWEEDHFGDLSRDGEGDWDEDGLSDREEFRYGTNPKLIDSDDDKFTDWYEVNQGTDPNDDADNPGAVPIIGVLHNVHEPDGSFKTYVEVLIEEGFAGNPGTEIDIITVTKPGGGVFASKLNFTYLAGYRDWFAVLDGSPPEFGTYTFTVVTRDGLTGTDTDDQFVNITIPNPDVSTFSPSAGETLYSITPTFSWGPVDLDIPLYYRLEIRKAGGGRVYATGRIRDMLSHTVPEKNPYGQTILEAGQTYEWRIRVTDDPDWKAMQNRANVGWQSFIMGSSLNHAATPGLDLFYDGSGVQTRTFPNDGGNPNSVLSHWVTVIDYGGVAGDGSSHTVTVTYPNGGPIKDLEFAGTRDAYSAYYELWDDELTQPINSGTYNGTYTYLVTDLAGNWSDASDGLTVATIAPPDETTFSPGFNTLRSISASFDNVNVNGALYDDFESGFDDSKWEWQPDEVDYVSGEVRFDKNWGPTSGSVWLQMKNPENIDEIKATVRVDSISTNDEWLYARIGGTYCRNNVGEVYARVAIQGNEAIFIVAADYWEGHHLIYNPLNPDTLLGPVAQGNRYELTLDWNDSTGTFTCRVLGLDDAVNYSDTFTVPGPIYPTDNPRRAIGISSWVSFDTTTPELSWAHVSGATHYRVRIYDWNNSQIYQGYETAAAPLTYHKIPPGILKPDGTYKLRIYALRDHQWFEWDNVSNSGWDTTWFVIEPIDEAQDPYIDLASEGVRTWTYPAPYGTYTLFYVKIHDAQGVPENIKSVKVTLPTGPEVKLYLDYNETSTCGVYQGIYFDSASSGTYTFQVMDRDGNSDQENENFSPSPINSPYQDFTIAPVNNTLLSDTAVNFNWGEVTGAEFYQINLYDKDANYLFNIKIDGTEPNPDQYILPPGILKEKSFYRYRIYARGEFFEENIDNYSMAPFGHVSNANTFITTKTDGTSTPGINGGGFGVVVWHAPHPATGSPVYWLELNALVTDADGVPENIERVEVTDPNGSKRTLKFRDFPDWGYNYHYFEVYSDPADIPIGIYKFDVIDFDGNKTRYEDTLADATSNVLSWPTGVFPPDGYVFNNTTPTITWGSVPGAQYYKVRILTAWDVPTVHWSEELTDTQYTVPAETLSDNTTYGFRVYAFKEPINSDVDFYSSNRAWHAANYRFSIQTQDSDGDGMPDDWEEDQGFDPGIKQDAGANNDGDALSNLDEYHLGTDPFDADTDNDGVNDDVDAFPLDASETLDTDGDGIGDNTDDDIDGDGYSNDDEIAEGSDELDPESVPGDVDGDGIPDTVEDGWDNDSDGVTDLDDNCENKPNGPDLGTCVAGSVELIGTSCNSDSACGTGGGCSMDQEDADNDGFGDVCDNCPDPDDPNADQADFDDDNVGDVCDNAPEEWNPGQEDADSDGLPDVLDNCPAVSNPMVPYATGDSSDECAIGNFVDAEGELWQPNYDCDDMGDACDDELSQKPKTNKNPPPPDTDEDGIIDSADNCPDVPNDQTDTDADGQGDACDMDDDGDGISDYQDRCPIIPDDGTDTDSDGLGDACDNCVFEHNFDQADSDRDGVGNACDNCADIPNQGQLDSDGDDVGDSCDNCRYIPNTDQADDDGDGIGNACEPPVSLKFEFQDLTGSDPYDAWLPEYGRRAQITAIVFENVDGVEQRVEPQPTITFTIIDNLTSNHAGKYTNDESPDTSLDYNAECAEPCAGSITITSHDYGGSTVILAETSYGGGISGELKIPMDKDDDDLPDAWEVAHGFNPVKPDSDVDGLPDKQEDEDRSLNNEDIGDGLTAFEEYRGVMWEDIHYRLYPNKKNLFVCGVDFPPGMFGIGDAFANAGVDVLSIETTTDGSGQIIKNYEDEYLSVLIIRSYQQGWSTGDKNSGHIRRVGVRLWDIPVLGESYFGYTGADNLYHYGQPTRIFTQSMLNYRYDGPYIDHNPEQYHLEEMLDPLDAVEDADDDGIKDKKEDTNRNGILDGDKVETDLSTWDNPGKINPFNIDNDDFLELPQNTGDPTQVPAGDEYDLLAVYEHVITHEIGHSVGMGAGDENLVDNQGHCFDQTCVMYHYSIDWKRADKFCPFHQGQIHVDNFQH